MSKTSARFFILSLCAVATVSCVQKMGIKGRIQPHEGRIFWAGRVPDGTIAYKEVKASSAASEKPKITKDFVLKGRNLYEAYCMPCHGVAGYGDGMVVQRGFLAPPSYHQDRLRNAPDQHFFDVMTNGFGAMYSYADRVTPEERWAIVSYIRALQLSQNAGGAVKPGGAGGSQ